MKTIILIVVSIVGVCLSFIMIKQFHRMRKLMRTVSKATHKRTITKKELLAIDPSDVEKTIGLKKMAELEHTSRRIGWGTKEYWLGVHRRARISDRVFCQAIELELSKDDVKN